MPDSTAPGRVANDGPWWRRGGPSRPPTPPVPTPPPARELLAGTPEFDPNRNARGAAAARAVLGKPKPVDDAEEAS